MPLLLNASPATFTDRGFTSQLCDPKAVKRTVTPTKVDEAISALNDFAAELPDTGWIVTGTWVGSGAPRGYKAADAAGRLMIKRPPQAVAA